MKTTRLVNMLLTVSLLCIVSVAAHTMATSDSSIAAQEHVSSSSGANRIHTQAAPTGQQTTLLAERGELRLRGVSWNTGWADGTVDHQPISMDEVQSQQVPDLKLVKEAEPLDGLRSGDALTFTLTLSGAGLNVVLWDPLPESVNYVEGSVTAPASFDFQAKAITWQGTLPSDSALTVRFQVTPTISGTGVFSLVETIINTAWLTDTDSENTVVASIAVNAHRVFLPLIRRPDPNAIPGWQTILRDDFEGTWPGPWDLEYDPGTNPYLWAKRDCRPYSGSYSAWVAGANSGSPQPCGAYYPDNLLTYMKYGPFSLAGATNARLTFQLWLNATLGENPLFGGDYMYWGASLDGEDFQGFFLSESTNGWKETTLDLTHVPDLGNLAGKPKVWIVLAFQSDFYESLPEGAYVDDVLLQKTSSQSEEVRWQQFSFTEVGAPARGCQPADPEGLPCGFHPDADPAGPPPWTLSVPAEEMMLKVTDGFSSGDVFDVYDHGSWIGRTSVANPGADCFEPDACYENPDVSSGEFPLAAGQHSITIVPSSSPNRVGAAFFRMD